MLICVEGISCSGKTTLIEYLLKNIKNSKCVGVSLENKNKYVSLNQIIVKNADDEINLQKEYINLVMSRIDKVKKEYEHCNDSLVILDRYFWSFYAHGLAKFKYTYQSNTHEFQKLFNEIILAQPIAANLNIIIQIPYDIWLIRAKERLKNHLPHSDLYNYDFYYALYKSYYEIYNILSNTQQNVIYLDDHYDLNELLNLVNQKIILCNGNKIHDHTKTLKKALDELN